MAIQLPPEQARRFEYEADPVNAGRLDHGAIDALGFRIRNVAYLPDVAHIPDDIWPDVEGLDIWIVDALRRNPHPTHAHLERTLEWIERAKPKRAIVTNMHIDMDYDTLTRELPKGVEPAYDGMRIEIEQSR